MGGVKALLDRVWRDEAGSMLGVLSRRLGDLDLAEDALQEAVGEALRRWPADGVPDSPTGWLVTAAWRKAVDRLRRERAGRRSSRSSPVSRRPSRPGTTGWR
ncbi:sigma factor [Phytohabitans houttuyneae]|uniref:RNA polymerase sigma-70 region 2 domain-containing protein n=1 Tax=Phytohabitans houttuyneae TaxID=1076126 RepID=A0A6V8KP70_9ACTN|nr:sigma factor [Phytohabitans houttuyneae]GFJ84408.1 hypothetical protein Phou_085880 [Phytohabitans houttuyneae]